METMPLDPEPAAPTTAEWVAEWAEDGNGGVHRFYNEPTIAGAVHIIGFQKFDGTDGYRAIYLRGGELELTAVEARALAHELLDAADCLAV